jgi:hypothetical protein
MIEFVDHDEWLLAAEIETRHPSIDVFDQITTLRILHRKLGVPEIVADRSDG